MWLICIFVFAYLSYLYFSFFLFYAPYLLFYFFFYLLPSRILDTLRFQAGGRRRRPNLGLVCISLLLAVFFRERPIWVKRPMSDVPIFRRKNFDVRFRCSVVRSCFSRQGRRPHLTIVSRLPGRLTAAIWMRVTTSTLATCRRRFAMFQ